MLQNTPNSFTFYVLVWKGHNLSWVAKNSSVSTWCKSMMATTYPLIWVCIVHNWVFPRATTFWRVVLMYLQEAQQAHIYTIRQAIVLALGTPTSSSGLLYWTIEPKQSPGSASFSSIFFHARSDMGCGLVCSWDIRPFCFPFKSQPLGHFALLGTLPLGSLEALMSLKNKSSATLVSLLRKTV